MQAHVVIVAGVAAALGWVARGVATSAPDPPPPTAVRAPRTPARLRPPPPVALAPPADDDAGEPGDDAGEDLGELLARAQALADAHEDAHEGERERVARHGQVSDARSGEPLARVVVTVSSDRGVYLITMTEDDGTYEITGLAPGTYTVTFDYRDVSLVRDHVLVTSFDPTRVSERLAVPERTPLPPRRYSEVSFSGHDVDPDLHFVIE